jgi:hypothetical protein
MVTYYCVAATATQVYELMVPLNSLLSKILECFGGEVAVLISYHQSNLFYPFLSLLSSIFYLLITLTVFPMGFPLQAFFQRCSLTFSLFCSISFVSVFHLNPQKLSPLFIRAWAPLYRALRTFYAMSL